MTLTCSFSNVVYYGSPVHQKFPLRIRKLYAGIVLVFVIALSDYTQLLKTKCSQPDA